MILPQHPPTISRYSTFPSKQSKQSGGCWKKHGQVDPVALYSNSHSHLSSAAEEAMDLPPKLRKIVLSACQARWDGQVGFSECKFSGNQWNNGILFDTLLLIFPFGREQGMYKKENVGLLNPVSLMISHVFAFGGAFLPIICLLYAGHWSFSHLFIWNEHIPLLPPTSWQATKLLTAIFVAELTKTMVGNWWSSEWLGTLMFSCFYTWGYIRP